MDWLEKPGRADRGSRPRCVLLCDGRADQVARRLTEIAGGPEVKVSANDHWQPQGTGCVREAQLDKVPPGGKALLPVETRQKLRKWWLAEGGGRARTPNWDIASACRIFGREGLLLVEAKAHQAELSPSSGCGATSIKNRERITYAVAEANAGLREVTGSPWQLSAEHHCQLANRFAWSWKPAKLKVPVVLVYLGFLDAVEMNDGGCPFQSDGDWRDVMLDCCRDVIDMSCWERTLDVDGTRMLPLMRTLVPPFEPQ